jgi:alkylhydroperoxidase family enzyme
MAGFTADEAIAIRRGEADFDERLAALLPVARETALHKGYVDDATWQRAIDAGWTDEQLLEAFADVVRTLLTNYFNHFVGTEVDLPRVPSLDDEAAA